MPDDVPIFDLYKPYPKAIIEGPRQAIVAALDDINQQIGRVDDAFLLLLTTCDFAQSTLNTVRAGQAAIGGLQAAVGQLTTAVEALPTRLDDIEERLTVLEAAVIPPADPTVEVPA